MSYLEPITLTLKKNKPKKFRIKLNAEENYLVRLSSLNVSDDIVADFLEISLKKMEQLKKRLLNKYEMTNWTAFLIKCFDIGLLNKLDYSKKFHKRKAVELSEKIKFKYFNFCGLPIPATETFLTKLLDKYLDDVKLKINSRVMNLSDREKSYLLGMVKGKSSSISNKKHKTPFENHGLSKQTTMTLIYRKLNVKNDYNAIKIAGYLGLFSKPEESSFREKLVKKAVSEIQDIIRTVNLDKTTKQFKVYSILIQLQTSLELENLKKILGSNAISN